MEHCSWYFYSSSFLRTCFIVFVTFFFILNIPNKSFFNTIKYIWTSFTLHTHSIYCFFNLFFRFTSNNTKIIFAATNQIKESHLFLHQFDELLQSEPQFSVEPTSHPTPHGHRGHARNALRQWNERTNIFTQTYKTKNAKVSIQKRRRSNVAVIIVRIVFICSFLFYCLLLNHSFQTNPNRMTNCFQLFSLFTTYNYICSMRSLFLIFEQSLFRSRLFKNKNSDAGAM